MIGLEDFDEMEAYEMETEQVLSEEYKNMKTRMKWNEVCQNPESERLMPECSVRLPFVSRVREPIEYFRDFVDNDVMMLITNQSNLYSMQKDREKPLFLELAELDIFIGICFYMSLGKLPRTRLYWEKEMQVEAVSKYMTCKRWETIKSNLHFSNNEEAPAKGTPGYDRIFKIRPLIDLINTQFNKIPMTGVVDVDEQIIPYSGTRGP